MNPKPLTLAIPWIAISYARRAGCRMRQDPRSIRSVGEKIYPSRAAGTVESLARTAGRSGGRFLETESGSVLVFRGARESRPHLRTRDLLTQSRAGLKARVPKILHQNQNRLARDLLRRNIPDQCIL